MIATATLRHLRWRCPTCRVVHTTDVTGMVDHYGLRLDIPERLTGCPVYAPRFDLMSPQDMAWWGE